MKEELEMKRTIVKRGLLGLPLGIAIGFLISLAISMFIGDGLFHPVAPELAVAMGGELNAVVFQTVLCAVMGAGFAMASVIWEMDSWSLAKQSIVYFLIASVLMLPIAYASNWMEHSFVGFLSYAGIFVAIFVVVWIAMYLSWKWRIGKMNASIGNGHGGRKCK